MLKDKIGNIWENIIEMQEDLECELKGEVYFGDIQTVAFSSAKRMEIYNEVEDEEDGENESYTLEFAETENGIKLIDVY